MAKELNTKGAMAKATAGTDIVEIKVTVSEKKERAAWVAFGLNQEKCQRRCIYFFDTPGLELSGRGVVLRARKVEKAPDDSTVKFRPVDPLKIAAKWRRAAGFKIEADGVGATMTRSASLSAEQNRGEIDEVVCGKRPIEKLFSTDQEAFLSDMGSGPVVMHGLEIFGPVEAMRWQIKHPGLPYRITIENWFLPDGRDLIELSFKAPSSQAAGAAAAFTGFLTELGLKPQTAQRSKTRMVMDYFSKLKLKKAG